MEVSSSDMVKERSREIENQLKDEYSLLKVVLAIEKLL